MTGLISTSDAFKAAARAFNTISNFTNLTFQEITESGNIVGDFRIGLVNADKFGMSSEFAAYSQGISNSPQGGNIFFNGGKDSNSNGTLIITKLVLILEKQELIQHFYMKSFILWDINTLSNH